MKKIIWILTLLGCLMFSMSAWAAQDIYVDGTKLKLETSAEVINSRTFVPMRTVFNALGAEVNYNAHDRAVLASKGKYKLKLQVDSHVVSVNDANSMIEVVPYIKDEKLMIPLRLVGESLGATVNYENGVIKIESEQAKIHFLEVGHGDSIFIQIPGGYNVLIDAGERNQGPLVEQYLKKLGVKSLDLLIATSPREEHLGGIPHILSNFPVKELIDSGRPGNTPAYTRYIEELARQSLKRQYALGQKYNYGDISLELLTYHNENSGRDLGQASIVSVLNVKGKKILFLGDVTGEELGKFKSLGPVALVKLGDHGSANSVDRDTFAALKPEYVVISHGKERGYPAPETLNALNFLKLKAISTDVSGNTVATVKPTGLNMSTEESVITIPQKPVPPTNYGKYYGSVKGDTYHIATCSKGKDDIKLADRVWFLDEYHAESNGYQSHSCTRESR